MSTMNLKGAFIRFAVMCSFTAMAAAQTVSTAQVTPNLAGTQIDDPITMAAPRHEKTQSLDEDRPSVMERANERRDVGTRGQKPTNSKDGERGANANGVGFEGNVSYSYQDGNATLKADKVSNRGGGTTGSIRIQLWATASSYNGGSINGYIMAKYQFSSTLGPRQYFSNVNRTVSFTTPPSGTYHVTMTAEEYTNSGWVIRDYIGFSRTATFGGGGNPGNGGGGGLSSAPVIEGNASFQIRDGNVTLAVDRVINKGGATTGSLRMELWATSSAYGGGSINGYVVGAFQFSTQLNANQYFQNVQHTVPATLPPNGSYYATLTLEEYTASGWVIRSYVTFNSKITVGNPDTRTNPCAAREIATNARPVNASLTADSCLNSGYRVDGYKFYAAAGSRIKIVMSSPDFYTLQVLFGPGDGDALATAVEGVDDGLTTVVITVPVSGTYLLIAGSADPRTGAPGGLGSYSIQVEVF